MGGKNSQGALIFESRGLCKNFGPTVALDHVDFQGIPWTDHRTDR